MKSLSRHLNESLNLNESSANGDIKRIYEKINSGIISAENDIKRIKNELRRISSVESILKRGKWKDVSKDYKKYGSGGGSLDIDKLISEFGKFESSFRSNNYPFTYSFYLWNDIVAISELEAMAGGSYSTNTVYKLEK